MVSNLLKLFLIACVAAALASTPVLAKKKNKGNKGNNSKTVAVVINPACLISFDEQIVVSQGEDADGVPQSVEVIATEITDSSEPPVITPAPDMGWVHCPLTLQDANPNGKGKTFDQYVVGVELCHREDAASSIGAIMLSRLDSSEPVLHFDDNGGAGFPTSDVATCLLSPVGIPFTAHHALSLDIKLNFRDIDPIIKFSTLRIVLSTQPNSNGLSSPSEPSIGAVSEPSVSAVSEPSQ